MERLKKVFEELGIGWSARKEERLLSYMDGILERNEEINLTAIKDRDEFITKHYIDSVLCCDSEEFLDAENIIDVGTGGGFPGVPLAVAFPEKKFVLMDSLNKRVKIIEELCRKAGIKNVKAVHGRAEDLARKQQYRDHFDVCVSRAVANMSTLCEYCLPFVSVDGTFIAYKGPDSDAEIRDSEMAVEALGGELDRIEVPEVSGFEFEHRLVYVQKISKTPKKYPRKAGTPAKDPLK